MSEQKLNLEELKNRIAALPPEKRAIFEQQLKQKNLRLPQKTIPKRQDLQNFPLSLAQERLWFLHQLDPENPAYNIAIAWRFTGRLNLPILEKSFNEIICRHECLRTRFTSVQGKPVLEIDSPAPFIIPRIDLQDLSEKQREKEVQRLTNEAAKHPFNLAKGSLLRVTLVQLSSQESIVLVILHHIIADGWSRGILLKELATLYKAFSLNNPSPLPDLPIQYGDFAAWQRQWLAGEELKVQLDYWTQKLADLSVLNLPTDYPRPSIPTLRGGIQSFTLDKPLTDALKNLSRQQGVTLFMTLLAAFKVLLHRYSSQDDIVVGSPIANRNWTETEGLIGFFINTLVLRSDLSRNPSFLALLKQVQATTAKAYQHQDLPFAKLVETLQPERDESHNPLFQVMFQVQNEAYQLQNALSPELAIPGLTLSQSWIDTHSTKFDLTWHLVERETGMLAVIEYSLDLFKAETIARMLGHFQVLLGEIITNPQARISELSLLTQVERQQLLIEWNVGETGDKETRGQGDKGDKDVYIHQLFEAQVEKTPNAIALTFETQQLTYQELNAKANQLAHYLQKLGVKPEVKVGILVERSPQMLIGILGVLKAGGAYIPLDPTYPSERIAFMLEDAQITVLLTETNSPFSKGGRGGLPSAAKISLDQDWPLIASESEENPISRVVADNLAYVIYTSGSTGKPKGTLITHRGLSNYLTWAIATYPVTQGNGSPVNSSIAFDATITSLFTPLLVGQKVVLLPEIGEIEALSEALTHQSLSLVKLTPAHLGILNPLLANKERTGQSHALIIGGEALSPHHLTFWQEYAPNTRLINEYGPTETVVGCCVYEVPSQASYPGNVPIGRPIANTQLYILDQYLQPTPVGIPGELYIGGFGVARGYYNRPDLTAERFIPNPFEGNPPLSPYTPRLYKTGDLARYLPDGTIEYLGRIDNQVKIRGFRIELGEIEGVLGQHPEVQEAIAVVQRDQTGNPRLVAYVVSQSHPHDLRQFLAEKLPAYMVPTLFITLTAFPLTPNGKVDRQGLPVPDFSQRNVQKDLIDPRTSQEAALVGIWQDVLGKMEVGIYDNFFELGGDSILGLQIIARANQAGLQLTPRQLFQSQTIAELAAVAGVSSTSSAEQGIVTGSVPLTPIQHWFFEQNLPDPHHYNQSLLLETLPMLNPQYLEQALHHLLIHHDALRLRFSKGESGWQQNNGVAETSIPFSAINLSNLTEKEQTVARELVSSTLQTTLNLSEGPTVRVAWFYLGKEKNSRLLWVIHHLAVDSVSWRILLEDLVTVYQQLEQGETVKLPPKTTSYQNWAKRLQDNSQSEKLESDCWSIPHQVSLPMDYPARDNNTVASSDRLSLTLSVEKTRALQEEVASAYHAQVNEVLLAALTQSICQWTGQRSLVIDLEGHGREDIFEDINLSRTVGWFTAIFPLELDLNFVNSLAEIIKSVKEQFRQVSKKGIDYGILHYLQQKQENHNESLINFNYLGQIDAITAQGFILGLAQESVGWVRSPLGTRRYLLEITGAIVQKQLQLTFTYSRHIHRRETVESLTQKVLSTLDAFIIHCQSSNIGGYTPSDFVSANLNQKQLDQFLGKLKQSGKKSSQI